MLLVIGDAQSIDQSLNFRVTAKATAIELRKIDTATRSMSKMQYPLKQSIIMFIIFMKLADLRQ